MTGRWGNLGKHLFRLDVQILVLLTLAILPIGAISVYQTNRIIEEAEALSETALLGQTARAVSGQRAFIERTVGAVRTLAISVKEVAEDEAQCRALMSEVRANNPEFEFVGFIGETGIMDCDASGATVDFSQSEDFQRLRADPHPVVRVNSRGQVTNKPVIILSEPVLAGDRLLGFLSISIPALIGDIGLMEDDNSSMLILFNADGEVLASDVADDQVADALPRDVTLAELFGSPPSSFTSPALAGERRSFAVVPVVPERVFALGSWDTRDASGQTVTRSRVAVSFPVLMWCASLLVAYFGVRRLVVNHVHRIQRHIHAFGAGRRGMPALKLNGAARELDQVTESLNRMMAQIESDERVQEASLHEKSVLLREVYHRVKNNLQLISSIINMQIRTTRSPEARSGLKRIQDRVMSLATIHRNLYTSVDLASVRADQLLRDVIGQILNLADDGQGAPKIVQSYDPVSLYPDQAVPLSLLATEAATNAVKHAGRAEDGERPWVEVQLKDLGDRRVLFSIANSVTADDPDEENRLPSSGLGSRLMEAFVAQLGAQYERIETENSYRIEVRFTVAGMAQYAEIGEIGQVA